MIALAVAVICGAAQGNAFYIGGGQYLTAAHVAYHLPCHINGRRAWVMRYDEAADLALLYSPDNISPRMSVACVDIRPGRTYRAVGVSFDVPLFALRNRDDAGMVMFLGSVRTGASGAPLVGSYSLVYGLVTRHSPARGRALAETFVCRGRA